MPKLVKVSVKSPLRQCIFLGNGENPSPRHTIIWSSFTPRLTFSRAVHSKVFLVCQASDSPSDQSPQRSASAAERRSVSIQCLFLYETIRSKGSRRGRGLWCASCTREDAFLLPFSVTNAEEKLAMQFRTLYLDRRPTPMQPHEVVHVNR